MWGIVTQVEKEGLVLVAVDKINRFQIEPVGQVLVFSHAIIWYVKPSNGLRAEDVGPEIGAVAHAFDFAPSIPAEAVIGRANLEFGTLILVTCKVPLANHTGAISVLLENLWEGDLTNRQGIGRVGPKIVENSYASGVLSGQERGPVGRADGSCCVGVCKAKALLGQFVEVGGLNVGMSHETVIGVALIIRQNQDNVGRLGQGRGCKRKEKEEKGCFHRLNVKLWNQCEILGLKPFFLLCYYGGHVDSRHPG